MLVDAASAPAPAKPPSASALSSLLTRLRLRLWGLLRSLLQVRGEHRSLSGALGHGMQARASLQDTRQAAAYR